ncbi:YihY/virulence factor BrkB family protein, partial [Candidatus Latescibacterota bacterium]
ITIWFLGLIFGEQAAEGEVVQQIQQIVGQKTAEVMQEIITRATEPPTKHFATLISIPLVMFGATMIFFQLQNALHFIWEIDHIRRRGITGILIEYFLSFPKVLIVGTVFLLLIIKSYALTVLKFFIQERFPTIGNTLPILDFILTLGIITVLFAMIYHFVPKTKIHWSDIWIGAGVTSLLFTIGQFFIGIYFSKTDIDSAYGAIGSFTILFIWIFYSSLIFLFGAVFTKIYSQKHNSSSH